MKTILLAVLAAATSVAAGVALAASSGGASETIFACKHPSGGWLRQVSESAQCRRRETPVSWNIAGPKGDPGEPGAPRAAKGDKGDPGTAITGLKTLEGVPCVAEDSAAGEIKVTIGASGDVTLTCEAAPDGAAASAAASGREREARDQRGRLRPGRRGRKRLRRVHNTGGAAADLSNVDLVASTAATARSTTGSR